jgi:hypothetical protein
VTEEATGDALVDGIALQTPSTSEVLQDATLTPPVPASGEHSSCSRPSCPDVRFVKT